MEGEAPETIEVRVPPKESSSPDEKTKIEKVRQGLISELPDEIFGPSKEDLLLKLRENGLMRIYSDLRIPLLPAVTAGQREELDKKGAISLREGKETDVEVWYYPQKEEQRRVKGIVRLGIGHEDLDYTGTHYSPGAKVVTLVCHPERLGERLLKLSNVGELDQGVVERLRVHEYTHRWNSETSIFAQEDVTAEFFREAHSVMAEYLSGVHPEEKVIIDILSQNKSEIPEKEKAFYVANFETHPRMTSDPQARARAEYATVTLWKLLVLNGGNFRTVGEQVILFQNRHMLNWDPKQTLCPKIEARLVDLMKEQSLDKTALEEQIKSYKLKLKEQWGKISAIIKNGLRDFTNTVDLTNGVVFSRSGEVSYCVRRLGGQFLGRGSVFEVKLDSEGFHLSIVDFKREKISQIDSDLSENMVDFWSEGVGNSLKNGEKVVSNAVYCLEKSLLLSPDSPYLRRAAEKIVEKLEKSGNQNKYLSDKLRRAIAAS